LPAPLLPFPSQAAPDLRFAVDAAAALDYAAVPTLRFALRLDSPLPVRSVALAVEVRIGATRRAYDEGDKQRLVELFGAPEDWGRNLHALHWTSVNLTVPAFSESTVVDLLVPCTYDLEVTGARYLNALEDGDVPLEFMFTGSIFYSGDDGRLQVGMIPWDREASYRLPVAVWRGALERHFPGAAWLRVRRETFQRLTEYRARHTLLGFDDAIDRLLAEDPE
jgi:hypothetical protein